MALRDLTMQLLRKNSLRAFRRLAKTKGGVSYCTYYPATRNGVDLVQRNIYHDVISSTGPEKSHGFSTQVYIDIMPPTKVVKGLGWWKEGDALPMLAYMPYEEGFEVEVAAKIVLPKEEGTLSGTYIVQQVKTYGIDTAAIWVCTLVADRESNITI